MAASSSSSDVPASPIGEAACLKGKLFLPIQPHAVGRHKKITIVGAGAVGLACAYSILNQGTASELALVDPLVMHSHLALHSLFTCIMLMSRVQIAPSLKGELMDLQQGSAFARRCIIRGSSDYAVSANSTLVIITAGARQREGESRLDLVGRNLEIFKSIVPQVVKHSPDCVIMVVSNPVDVMTHITQRLSGFPVGRVFGSGTALDSSRFRTLVAEKLGVDTRSVHGMIVGEHGDSSVACWSALTVGGVRMRDLSPVLGRDDDPDNWSKLHKDVINSAYEIIKSKGYTNWAIGMTVASLAEAVMRNEHRVLTISIPATGRYGITEDDVYLSLPAVVGSEGVTEALDFRLEDDEAEKLRKSASAIGKVQSALKW